MSSGQGHVPSGAAPAPGEAAPAATLPPADQAAADEAANHELYKAFQDRESAATSPTPNAPETGSQSGADEGVAPSDSAPVTPPVVARGDAGDEADTGDRDGDAVSGVPAPVSDDVDDVDAATTTESITFLDRTFTRDEATQALQVVDWARNLQPDHVQAIDAVLSGDYVLVSRAEHEAAQVANRAAPAGSLPPSAGAAPFDDDDDLDPAVRARLDRLNASVDALTNQQQQALARQQQDSHAQILAAVSTGASRFATAHELSADESRVLQERVVSMQILPGYATTYNNDAAMAMEKAMEAVYWSDDTYRQREMDKRLESERQTRGKEVVKQRKAGSLTGTGGSAARVEPPATKEDRRSEMVKEVANAMNGGQRT